MPISEAITSVKWIRLAREEGSLLSPRSIVSRQTSTSFCYDVDVVVVAVYRRRLHPHTCYSSDCFVLIQSTDILFSSFSFSQSLFRTASIFIREILEIFMASRTYFDRILPRRSLGGFYTGSLSSLIENNVYSSLAGRTLVRTAIFFLFFFSIVITFSLVSLH